METSSHIENGVNGDSLAGSSPGIGRHERQVHLDRHHETARSNKKRNVSGKMLRVGTWNVRTMSQIGKLENVKMEMDRLKMNVLGISEMRWPGSGKLCSGEHVVVFSGGLKHEHGVGMILDEEREKSLLGF